MTTENAYLTEEVLARPNLTVATNASVTRILFDTPPESNIRAVGVEFVSKQGHKFQAQAMKEVIISYVLTLSLIHLLLIHIYILELVLYIHRRCVSPYIRFG